MLPTRPIMLVSVAGLMTALSGCADLVQSLGYVPPVTLEFCTDEAAGIRSRPTTVPVEIAGVSAVRVLPDDNTTQAQADTANACIERAARGSQSSTATQTDGAVTTVTYTYGTPPAAAPAPARPPTTVAVVSQPPAPAPAITTLAPVRAVAVTPAPAQPVVTTSPPVQAAMVPPASTSPVAGGLCRLEMTGGAGYTCRP